MTAAATCRIIRPGGTYDGKQGFRYFEGIARETVGSTGLCMHLLTIPPGGRARAHKHESHETAIYVISGEGHTWHGERLEQLAIVRAGEMFYIPAGMPHLAANLGDQPCMAVIARTDPNEQESVVLLPELDGLVEVASPLPTEVGIPDFGTIDGQPGDILVVGRGTPAGA